MSLQLKRIVSNEPKDAEHDPQNSQQSSIQKKEASALGYCNVWVGSTEERISDSEHPYPKLVEEDWELMKPDAGITVIYFPLLPNSKIEGVDPKLTDYLSTWNFVYTPKQIDNLAALAKANFEEGKEQTRRTVRAVYERKKARRLEREKEEKEWRRRWKLRKGRLGKKLGEGDHADLFS